jgi:alginate O-acetyltransferase complex protein AlgJ
LPIDGVLRAAGGILRWRVFDAGGPLVWAGRNDWLYLTEELRPWPDPPAAMAARARIAHQIAIALRARGIGLLMALVPDKARIESATLDDAPRAAQTMTRYADFVTLLRAQGLAVVDLDTAFVAARRAGPVYYRTDTHWNQTGAALAAQAIASAVTVPIARTHVYHTDADALETDGPGDLLRLMSLDEVPDTSLLALRPRPDRQHLEHTVLTKAPADTGGLLGDAPAIEVMLLGSSFSLNANFSGRLQEALGTPIADFAKLGGGFSSAAQAYLNNAAYRDTPPKLVIWEVPERVVAQPLDEADRALQRMVEESPAADSAEKERHLVK